jgi:streptogramin lyase
MMRKILVIVLMLGLLMNITALPAQALVTERTYTLDADFDEGILVGVEHETVHDQLQLSKTPVTLPFIWVPNYGGTISKVHTVTGNELGRYRVAPPDLGVEPNASRTTVDQEGSCYVGIRQAGTVVKIGLALAGNWIDRNGNGVPDTSRDANGDGDIDPTEMLPWGEDECVLYEIVLVPGHEGAYAPGTYAGPYDTNYWGVSPRGLAIDKDNNLWAGTWSTQNFYHINGATGAIMDTLDVSSWGHGSYGAVIDGNGILWSAMLSSHILAINTANTADITKIDLSHTYGLGLDYLGHLFVGGGGQLSRIDTVAKTIDWTKPARTVRGVVCTADNDVWVAGNDEVGNYDSVSRYDNDGNWKATIEVGNAPSGVAVDATGKVWVCDIGDENIHRIVPASNTIDLTKPIIGSGGHYTYSDMTGILSRTITTKIGTWTVVFDSEQVDMLWGKVSWDSEEPTGTSIMVKVRSSNDKVSWSLWENASNGVPLSLTPPGQYLEIETILKITQGEVSPILYDLTVQVGNLPPVADAGDDQELEQTSYEGAEATLDGSGSTDDGLIEPLTYEWTLPDGTVIGNEMMVTEIFPLGTTTLTLTVFDGQFSDADTVDIKVVDTTPPEVWCVEAVNPAGKNVPPAGSSTPPGTNPNSGKNPDGFYQIFAKDICDSAPEIYIGTEDNPMLFGPFESGIIVKITEAKGAKPSCKEIGGPDSAVAWHITLPSDAIATAVDLSGNSASCTCFVPPPPK